MMRKSVFSYQSVRRVSNHLPKHVAIQNENLIRHGGFVNNQFLKAQAGHKTFPVINPANGKPLVQLPCMTEAEVDQAIQVTSDTWQTWRKTTAYERSKILSKWSQLIHKNIDDLAKIVTLEAGKPFAEAKGEILYAVSFVDYYAEEAKRISGHTMQSPAQNKRVLTIKQAVGPVALITPWNFPSAMITRKLAPALAAGCTAILKPADETPLSALALCELLREAGLPPGVVNCLTTSKDNVQNVGRVLCHSPLLRKVSFTGSTQVGKWLMREAASTVKRVSLELGGNAPFIVFDDADLKVALQALMFSKFRNAGQACIASNRVFVQEGVYARFAELLSEQVRALRVGGGFEDGVHMGPLINPQGLAKVASHVQDCTQRGAKALTGGREHPLSQQAGGFFYEPTVLVDVTKAMLPYTQETFGPIVPLISFKTDAEVVEMANDTPFGLSAYFCTTNLARAWRLSEDLEVGMVGVNEGAISFAGAPFGGVKESGLGREGGPQGIEEYLEEKYVCFGSV